MSSRSDAATFLSDSGGPDVAAISGLDVDLPVGEIRRGLRTDKDVRGAIRLDVFVDLRQSVHSSSPPIAPQRPRRASCSVRSVMLRKVLAACLLALAVSPFTAPFVTCDLLMLLKGHGGHSAVAIPAMPTAAGDVSPETTFQSPVSQSPSPTPAGRTWFLASAHSRVTASTCTALSALAGASDSRRVWQQRRAGISVALRI